MGSVKKKKYNYLFTIQIPRIANRTKEFDKELEMSFNELFENAKQRSCENNFEKSVELSLIFYFYWIKFGALTRKSASLGGIILHALIIANGYMVTDPISDGMQIDWEAMTTSTHTEFIKNVRE